MTSSTIPPEDEISDEWLSKLLNRLEPMVGMFAVDIDKLRAMARELQSRRAAQPAREAIIEECAKIVSGTVYRERYRTWAFWPGADRHRDSDMVRFADDAAKAIRALKPAPEKQS